MKTYFYKPIDIAPLVVFRIFFGFLIACESFGAILTGWVYNNLVSPEITFNFIGFDFLQTIRQGNSIYYYFVLMGLLGVAIMLGFRYKIAIILYTFMWAGAYFMQKSAYNNHYYLLLIISFLMIFFPANKNYSLDVKYGHTKKEDTMPFWVIFTVIFQISIVYIFAALAKFYPDWLDGTFTKNLLSNALKNSFAVDLFSQKWFYLFIAYAGIAFDLFIIPLLLYKKTRTLALIASIIFHLFNAITLQIGIFPFFALTFALFFYNPSSVRKLFLRKNNLIEIDSSKKNLYNKKIFSFVIIPFLVLQLVLPIRHHFIKGNVLLTEEGHRLSWRMMLRHKSGFILFSIVDNKTKEQWSYNFNKNLSPKQAATLATKPDFIWQYCQKIKEEYKGRDISIYVTCNVSINNKSYQPLINPEADLAKAEWNYFFHNDWIYSKLIKT